MWPTLQDGQLVSFQPVDGITLSVGQVVLLPNPFDKREMIVKRISKINKNGGGGVCLLYTSDAADEV